MGILGLPILMLFPLFMLIGFGILLLPMIFFLLTMQRALNRCAPQNRTISPGQVWLTLIPFFNLVWVFFLVVRMSSSLGNEFRARNIPADAEPGKALGLAWAVLMVSVLLPGLGVLTGLAGIVCWIIYWVKIADYSRKLEAPAGLAVGSI